MFSYSKSMETINPWSITKLVFLQSLKNYLTLKVKHFNDNWGMIGIIFNGDYQTWLHTKL